MLTRHPDFVEPAPGLRTGGRGKADFLLVARVRLDVLLPGAAVECAENAYFLSATCCGLTNSMR